MEIYNSIETYKLTFRKSKEAALRNVRVCRCLGVRACWRVVTGSRFASSRSEIAEKFEVFSFIRTEGQYAVGYEREDDAPQFLGQRVPRLLQVC